MYGGSKYNYPNLFTPKVRQLVNLMDDSYWHNLFTLLNHLWKIIDAIFVYKIVYGTGLIP